MSLRHRDAPDDGLTDDDRRRIAAMNALGRDERLEAFVAQMKPAKKRAVRPDKDRAKHGPEHDRAKPTKRGRR